MLGDVTRQLAHAVRHSKFGRAHAFAQQIPVEYGATEYLGRTLECLDLKIPGKDLYSHKFTAYSPVRRE
jgi:hypothetical protein